MKVTDVLASFLKKNNINQAFGLQGGAVVHIFDSMEKSNIDVTYNHHEESAALAAVSNAKANKHVGCVVVTTGPGSTNAITGLLAAWQDSVPCIFISGQARSNHVSYNKKVRQVGTQEVNICDIVRPITKYTNFLKDSKNFLSELEKAYKIAISGRPGPVWLDIALELQWNDLKINKKSIKKILPINQKIKLKKSNLNKFYSLCKNSKKPLIVFGYGARLSDPNLTIFKKFIKNYKIPFVLTWNSVDFFSTDNPYNLGVIGMSGQRGANKAIFQSDLIICIGNHLSIPHTTTLYESYAPKAKKIIINIDKNQLDNLNIKFDLKIQSDAKIFFKKIKNKKVFDLHIWKNLNNLKSQNWYEIPISKKINSNFFIREASKFLKDETCIVVDGGGSALYSGFQSSIIKEKQRVICSSSISSMGTGLAESIGAHKSNIFKKIMCVIGDGSFLMNIQDLQNIAQDKMNIKIFLINNNGYLAIRHTQKEFLDKRFFGTDPKGGLSMPDFKKCKDLFGIKYERFENLKNYKSKLKKIFGHNGPVLCEVFTSEDQNSLFKQGYKKEEKGLFKPQPLSEMYPFFKIPISNTNN
jgi:acetolactate synthase I/II/III large subunit